MYYCFNRVNDVIVRNLTQFGLRNLCVPVRKNFRGISIVVSLQSECWLCRYSLLYFDCQMAILTNASSQHTAHCWVISFTWYQWAISKADTTYSLSKYLHYIQLNYNLRLVSCIKNTLWYLILHAEEKTEISDQIQIGLIGTEEWRDRHSHFPQQY